MPGGQKAVWLWAIPAAGAIVCAAWVVLLTSYRKLNRAKFAVLQEIEADLPVQPFKREREVYTRDKRRSLSYVETAIPCCFALLYAAMLIAASWPDDPVAKERRHSASPSVARPRKTRGRVHRSSPGSWG